MQLMRDNIIDPLSQFIVLSNIQFHTFQRPSFQIAHLHIPLMSMVNPLMPQGFQFMKRLFAILLLLQS
jgi:hypothetical protein